MFHFQNTIQTKLYIFLHSSFIENMVYMQTIDVAAFDNHAETFFQLHLYNLTSLANLPTGLLQGAVRAELIEITFTSISNLNAFHGVFRLTVMVKPVSILSSICTNH